MSKETNNYNLFLLLYECCQKYDTGSFKISLVKLPLWFLLCNKKGRTLIKTYKHYEYSCTSQLLSSVLPGFLTISKYFLNEHLNKKREKFTVCLDVTQIRCILLCIIGKSWIVSHTKVTESSLVEIIWCIL